MKRRYLSLFLALTLMILALSACGQQSEPQQSQTSGAQASGTGTVNGGQKPVTLSIVTESFTPTIDCGEMPMWQELQKELNITIKFDQVRSGWEERKAVILASNELPDIFLGGLTDGDIVTNSQAFVDMRALIDQYAPNVKKMFEANPAALAASSFPPDGAVYSLPLILGLMPESAEVMIINKTWLDKLNLEVPTTIDQLETVLTAFRNGDPNENGKADEIPLDWPAEAYAHGHDIYCLTGAFGAVDNQSADMPVVKNGKVDFLFTTDAFYKVTQYLHKWYKAGLINPEVYTNTYEQAGALSNQGETARVGVTTGWSVESRAGKFADQYIILPQLSASANSAIKPLWPSNPSQFNAPNVCELTTACKNPEAAMKLINMLYSDDYTLQNYYGSFPDNVTKHNDGTYTINAPANGDTIEGNKWKNALVNYAPGNFSDELEARVNAPAELTGRLDQDNVYAGFRPKPEDIFPSVKFDAETTEKLVYLKTDLYKLVTQKMAQWCVKGGIESEWDSYLKDLDKMGLEEYRAIMQTAYDKVYKGGK